MSSSQTIQQISVGQPEPLTPHDEALFEAGKAILVESISVGREFNKFMITITAGAIPIHLGLFKIFLPDKYILSSEEGLYVAIPAIMFLFSSIVFMLGYYPRRTELTLNSITNIEITRKKALESLKNKAISGTVIFVLAVILMIFFDLAFLNKVSNSPHLYTVKDSTNTRDQIPFKKDTNIKSKQ